MEKDPKARVKLSLSQDGEFAKEAVKAALASFGTDDLSQSRLCIVFEKRGNADFVEIGRSELLNKKSNIFNEKVVVDYFFVQLLTSRSEKEKKQQLKFKIYDGGEEDFAKSPPGLLATADCTLGRICGSPGSKYAPPVVGIAIQVCEGKAAGGLVVLAEEVKAGLFENDKLELSFRGHKLAAKDPVLQGGKSDPYLKIFRKRKDGQLDLVKQTEVIPNNLYPTWLPFEVTLLDLCNGDLDAPLLIECWDEDKGILAGGDDMIGLKDVTARQLIKRGCEGGGAESNWLQLDDYKARKTAIDPGKLFWDSKLTLEKREQAPTFLDYLNGGYKIKLSLAIDWTASNGSPKNKDSLHYSEADKPNPYQRALSAVLDVILPYDSDDSVDLMGFGGIPGHNKGTKQVSHCFPLDVNYSVSGGIEGVLETYAGALKKHALSGPTNFHEVIHHVVDETRKNGGVEAKAYRLLLIITDGAINDLRETTNEIIEASALPISIIIVGVGKAEFGSMKKMDSDDAALEIAGKNGQDAKKAKRDMVQFVPFRDFDTGDDVGGQVAAALLEEFPDQFLQHMCEYKVVPGGNWSDRYLMPQGDWYAASKVSSRDLDFGASCLGQTLAPLEMAMAMLGCGAEDSDANATPDTALYPEDF